MIHPHWRALRRFARAFRFLERRRREVLLAGGLAGLVFVALAARLELRTDLTELLPADHAAVAALREVTPRQRSGSSLCLIIDADTAVRAQAFADALTGRLEALRATQLTAIDVRPDGEPAAFAARWRWLYAELADLREIEALADALVARRATPLYVSIDDEDPEARLAALEARMKAASPATPTHARFQSDDGRTIGLRLWRRRDGLGGGGDHALMAAVRDAVAAALREVPGARVRYTGPIAQALEEQAAIRDDLSLATALCAALVVAVLWLALGNAALVACAITPTLLGLFAALALAAVLLGALNLNTAFLASIILGNGINAPIVVLAELRRQRDAGRSTRAALARALLASGRGVAAAMGAAALAYGVLSATRFRGFRQFGLIGGVGMLAVLAATATLLPALVLVLDAHLGRAVTRGRDRFSPLVLRALRRLGAPRTARVLAAGLSLLALGGALRFARAPIEWDLSRLRSRDSEAARLWPTMEALGMGSVGAGHIANTAVLLVDDAATAPRVARALLEADRRGERLLAAARTLPGLLPTEQEAKLAVLARLRARVDRTLARHGAALDEATRARLREVRPPDGLRAVAVDDLPRSVREAFTEVDGQRGRLIGIDADGARYHDWDGHTLLRLSRALSVEIDGRRYTAAAAATVFAGMLETLVDDAPRLALLSLLLVAALLAIVLRATAAPVLAALGLGLFWLAGFAGLLGLRLNFMSFAAVPISVGVGADYAANLWARRPARAGQPHPAAATIVLCSLTTIIGYSTLLLGRNGALRSFGVLCDLGELTCLLAALASPTLFARTR